MKQISSPRCPCRVFMRVASLKKNCCLYYQGAFLRHRHARVSPCFHHWYQVISIAKPLFYVYTVICIKYDPASSGAQVGTVLCQYFPIGFNRLRPAPRCVRKAGVPTSKGRRFLVVSLPPRVMARPQQGSRVPAATACFRFPVLRPLLENRKLGTPEAILIIHLNAGWNQVRIKLLVSLRRCHFKVGISKATSHPGQTILQEAYVSSQLHKFCRRCFSS